MTTRKATKAQPAAPKADDPATKAVLAKGAKASGAKTAAPAKAPQHWTERPEFLDMSSDVWWRAPGVSAQTSPQGVVTLMADGQHPHYAMAVAPVNSAVRNRVYRASAIVADAVSEHPGWALLRLEYQAGDEPSVMRDVVFNPVDGAFYAPEDPAWGRLGRLSPRRRGWLVVTQIAVASALLALSLAQPSPHQLLPVQVCRLRLLLLLLLVLLLAVPLCCVCWRGR